MDMLITLLPLLMFAVLTPTLFTGFPVAFVLGGVGFAFWLLAVLLGVENSQTFYLVISRIFGGVVQKPLLVAIPMFIFMGALLERSGLAEDLLKVLERLLKRVPGGLGLSVTVLGVILAATTGIIGASVVMLSLLALPAMLRAGYAPSLATGTVAASGTLGILLPPSIMLVVMADLLTISAGSLFLAAIYPALLLAGLYMLYLIGRAILTPDSTGGLKRHGDTDKQTHGAAALDTDTAPLTVRMVAVSLLPPLLLILSVLGSIFSGIATPTEASGIGAAGALVLAIARGKLDKTSFLEALERSVLTSAMIFGLFIGATAFSYVFTLLGGHDLVLAFIADSGTSPWSVLAFLMIIAFILGFFFDWIEITLIILPVFAPVIAGLDFGDHVPAGMTLVWFAILMAVNLQTSFLTPPFGFALFYMKGAAPKEIGLDAIYRGIIPFILLQLLGLALVLKWPMIALHLPISLSR